MSAGDATSISPPTMAVPGCSPRQQPAFSPESLGRNTIEHSFECFFSLGPRDRHGRLTIDSCCDDLRSISRCRHHPLSALPSRAAAVKPQWWVCCGDCPASPTCGRALRIRVRVGYEYAGAHPRRRVSRGKKHACAQVPSNSQPSDAMRCGNREMRWERRGRRREEL